MKSKFQRNHAMFAEVKGSLDAPLLPISIVQLVSIFAAGYVLQMESFADGS